jgi:hypothetical protein
MGVCGQRHAPAALYPRGNDPRYPLDRRLGGPQSRSGLRGRRKILWPCRGLNPDRPARSQTLYCLSYRCSYQNCMQGPNHPRVLNHSPDCHRLSKFQAYYIMIIRWNEVHRVLTYSAVGVGIVYSYRLRPIPSKSTDHHS